MTTVCDCFTNELSTSDKVCLAVETGRLGYLLDRHDAITRPSEASIPLCILYQVVVGGHGTTFRYLCRVLVLLQGRVSLPKPLVTIYRPDAHSITQSPRSAASVAQRGVAALWVICGFRHFPFSAATAGSAAWQAPMPPYSPASADAFLSPKKYAGKSATVRKRNGRAPLYLPCSQRRRQMAAFKKMVQVYGPDAIFLVGGALLTENKRPHSQYALLLRKAERSGE